MNALHVEVSGSGPDLVLLHGWGLHSGVWSEVLPALAARWRVHAVDLPGHGHSARVEIRAFDDAVDAVAERAPAGATLCGWSMGGLLAQRLALRHPGRVACLALVASTPCFAERPDWPHGMRSETLSGFGEELARDRDAMLKRFVALNALHGAARETVRAFTRRLLERTPPSDTGLEAGLEWLREVDLRAQASRLRIPAVVMHGSRDMLAAVGAGRWLAENLAQSRLLELPEAGHMPFFSHPRAFVDFLEGARG